MSKNFPSFVCYPKEGFQSTNPTIRQAMTSRPQMVTTKPQSNQVITMPPNPIRPSTLQPLNEYDWYFNRLENINGREQLVMTEFDYKYINLSLTDKMALKNYMRNPFSSNTSDAEKITILNNLSNPVKDALFLLPRHLGVVFDPTTIVERTNFKTAAINLSPDHRNSLDKYMNAPPYERSQIYNNLPETVKSIVNSNFAKTMLKLQDNKQDYGQKIYYPSNISITTGTSYDRISGGNVCVDDMCVNTDNIKDLMKSLITLIKQGGQYYKSYR